MPHKSREERNAYHRQWSAAHRVGTRAAKAKWRAKNPDRVRALKRRYANSAKGREAANAYARKWRAANPEHDRGLRRAWAAANPDKVKAQKLRRRLKKWPADQAAARAWALQRHYQLSVPEYDALLLAQAGRCAICGTDKANGRGDKLHVDHDHESGLIRGLLCNKCNSALGYFNDSPKRLRRAAAYLENWRGKTTPDIDRGFQPILGALPEACGEIGGDESLAGARAVA